MFFFQTGLRISEICAVRYEDIENGQLHIQRMYSSYDHTVKEKTKGLFGDRIIPPTDDALYLIQKAKEHQQEEGVSNTEYIFSMTCQPLPYSGLSKAFRHTCINSNILARSTHKARKTVISTLIDNGVNINTIREMMGHRDERTTLNSYCFDRKEKEERRQLMNCSLHLGVSQECNQV